MEVMVQVGQGSSFGGGQVGLGDEGDVFVEVGAVRVDRY